MPAPYRIFCVNCRKHVYNFVGEFNGRINRAEFRPARPGVPAPLHAMNCPFCLQAFYLVRDNGSVVMWTDQGWKPSAPEGQRFITTRVQPGDSPDLAGDRSEYRDPMEKP